jgi:hypothetical protein
MKLPTIPLPTADGLIALTEAGTICNQTRTMTAQLVIDGSAGDRRIPRTRWLADLSILESPPRARLEALSPSGPSSVIFWAQADDATVLLPRENRVLEHGPSAALLEALIGVPLAATDLHLLLTGCAQFNYALGFQLGERWQLFQLRDLGRRAGNRTYLHHQGGSWRVVVLTLDEGTTLPWRAEYSDFQENLARSIRLVTSDRKRFDLRVSLSTIERNVPLGSSDFRVQVPPSASPITLETLRRARPFEARARSIDR